MRARNGLPIALLAVALVGTTCLAFSDLLKSQFVNYDDNVYVTENAHVLAGLSAETAAWAFSTSDGSNWHPLTWLSHLLDVTLYGLDAGKHHRTSLWLHEANALLLFLLLASMTGSRWRSALAAGLFALHPLHVESVAWIAERKDVLSTLFWLLTLFAWARYVERKTAARYALVVVPFALGLMAKPMLVTLPFTLLLLDVWPLRREETLSTRVREKAPLFAMSAASCVVTFLVQRAGGAVQDLATMTLADRFSNAIVSYTSYLGKTVWPTRLAVFYPYTHALPAWRVAASLALLACITALAIRSRRRAPYLLFGWLWYAGTLVPVIGLIQVGGQAMADRYTYVPLIGIFIALAWGLAELGGERRPARYAASAVAIAVVVAAFVATRLQVAHWSDGTALFAHALDVTGDNWLAHNDLGLILFTAGSTDQAIAHYTEALRIAPNYVEAHNNLGNALEKTGRRDEAIAHFRRALALRPDYARVHNNIGVALAGSGRASEAIAEYQEALRIDPGYAKAHENLALALAGEGRTSEAIAHYERALHARPDSFETLTGLGLALARDNRLPDAITAFERAIAVRPDSAEARNNLAGALAAEGRLDGAIDQLQQAVRLDPRNAEVEYNLGNTLLRSGRTADAIEHYVRTLQLKPGDEDALRMLGEARRAARR